MIRCIFIFRAFLSLPALKPPKVDKLKESKVPKLECWTMSAFASLVRKARNLPSPTTPVSSPLRLCVRGSSSGTQVPLSIAEKSHLRPILRLSKLLYITNSDFALVFFIMYNILL
jgi:hypothetical protein